MMNRSILWTCPRLLPTQIGSGFESQAQTLGLPFPRISTARRLRNGKMMDIEKVAIKSVCLVACEQISKSSA